MTTDNLIFIDRENKFKFKNFGLVLGENNAIILFNGNEHMTSIPMGKFNCDITVFERLEEYLKEDYDVLTEDIGLKDFVQRMVKKTGGYTEL